MARGANADRKAPGEVRSGSAAGPVIWGPRSPQQQGETADPVDVEDVQLHPLSTASCISRPPNGVQGITAVATLARRCPAQPLIHAPSGVYGEHPLTAAATGRTVPGAPRMHPLKQEKNGRSSAWNLV